MSKAGNEKKAQQLGMPLGTASNKLRKAVLFTLLEELGRNICFQCNNKIEHLDDLSIEHKEPWLDSDDPVGRFFDLKNIAFSHLSCNVGAGRRPTKGHITHGYSGYPKCSCETCLKARREYKKEYRERTGIH